jgi:hypothetical protein
MAIKSDELAIPIIDLAPLRSGNPQDALETGKKVYDAFRGVGFAYIKNHGLPQELLDQAFEWVGWLVQYSVSPNLWHLRMSYHSDLFWVVLC